MAAYFKGLSKISQLLMGILRNKWLLLNKYYYYYKKFGKGSIYFVNKINKNKDELFEVNLKQFQYPLYIRGGTSDLECFIEVFMHNSFKIPFNFKPKYIFDIGANVGFASIYFRRRFPDSIIISLEPDASNFELLKKNTEKYKNIHCLQYGIWNKSTKLEIIENGNNKWNCRTVETTEGSHKASVPSITIDELMQMFNIEKIDILKMDIEGAEYNVFSGAHEKWMPKTKSLIVEMHDMIVEGCSRVFFRAMCNYNFSTRVAGSCIVCYMKE